MVDPLPGLMEGKWFRSLAKRLKTNNDRNTKGDLPQTQPMMGI